MKLPWTLPLVTDKEKGAVRQFARDGKLIGWRDGERHEWNGKMWVTETNTPADDLVSFKVNK